MPEPQITFQIASKCPVTDSVIGSFTLLLYWVRAYDNQIRTIQFELFEIIGEDQDAQPLYEGFVPQLDKDFCTAHGFVKWDGCTQFSVADVHVDSRKQLENLFHGISEARRLCAQVMADSYLDKEEYL